MGTLSGTALRPRPILEWAPFLMPPLDGRWVLEWIQSVMPLYPLCFFSYIVLSHKQFLSRKSRSQRSQKRQNCAIKSTHFLTLVKFLYYFARAMFSAPVMYLTFAHLQYKGRRFFVSSGGLDTLNPSALHPEIKVFCVVVVFRFLLLLFFFGGGYCLKRGSNAKPLGPRVRCLYPLSHRYAASLYNHS